MCVFVGLVDTGVGFGRCVYGERRKTASVEEKNKMVAIRWLQNEKASKVFGARYSSFETFSSVVSNVGEKHIWQFQILQNVALYFVFKKSA